MLDWSVSAASGKAQPKTSLLQKGKKTGILRRGEAGLRVQVSQAGVLGPESRAPPRRSWLTVHMCRSPAQPRARADHADSPPPLGGQECPPETLARPGGSVTACQGLALPGSSCAARFQLERWPTAPPPTSPGPRADQSAATEGVKLACCFCWGEAGGSLSRGLSGSRLPACRPAQRASCRLGQAHNL